MHRKLIDAHKEHGSLVRIAPGELSIGDLAAIKKIYGAGSKFRKSNFYSAWQGYRKFDLFGEKDERIHAGERSKVSRIYSLDSLLDLEPAVDGMLRLFHSKLSEVQGQVMDFSLWLQLFAFGRLLMYLW